MAVTRRRVLASAAAAALTVGLGGIAGVLPPHSAEAAIVPQMTMLPGTPLDLGDYQTLVPADFTTHADTVIPATDTDPEFAATLPRTWQLICTNESLPLIITLVATPYLAGELDAETIARLNAAEGPEPAIGTLLDCLEATTAASPSSDPIYLGFLPYQDRDSAFNLLFFSGLKPEQVTAVALLPGIDEAPSPTVLTAIFASQNLELLLPTIDQLFGALEPVQPEAERLAEVLEAYRTSRG